jgi:hypothetical protein
MDRLKVWHSREALRAGSLRPNSGLHAGRRSLPKMNCIPHPPAAASTVDLVTEYSRWDYVQVDPALQNQDLHAVGVAIKPLRQQVQPAGSVCAWWRPDPVDLLRDHQHSVWGGAGVPILLPPIGRVL